MPAHVHRVKVERLSPEMHLSGREVRHLAVMRLRQGDVVHVFDGQGLAGEAEVTLLSEVTATLLLLSTQTSQNEYPQPLTLAIALLKGDKLADVVRAGTELGAGAFQLLRTRYADVPDIGETKLGRLRRVAEEAAKQSRRAVVPPVFSPVLLSSYAPEGQLIYAHPGSSATLLGSLHWNSPLTLLSGPEGGLSDEEVERLRRLGALGVTLGPRILRAETAPLALLGALAASGV